MSELTGTDALSDLTDVNPPTGLPSAGVVSYIGMEDVSENYELLRTHDRNVRYSGSYTKFKENDLLFAKITPCMENGKGAVVRDLTNGAGFGSTEFHILRATNGDPGFLAQWLQSRELRRAAEAQMTGSAGQRRVPSNFFAKFRVQSLTLPEQRRIAEILDTLDNQIRATEQIIAKLHVAKRGLNDALVGDRSPNSILGQALLGSPANGIYKPASQIGRGTFLVGQTAITSDRVVDPALARLVMVTQNEEQRFGLQHNDILVSRVFATLEGVGQPAIVPELTEPAVYESNMMRLRCDRSRAVAFFVFETLQTNRARAHVVRHANLSNQASISQDVLTELPAWVPDVEEQRRITTILRAADRERIAELRRLSKLRAVKAGLMSDLLSGRVRVPVETAS